MRERHPIDERFKALHDAEATPPVSVHESLAAHMGWSNGTKAGGFFRPLGIAAIVVVGIGTAIWFWPGASNDKASDDTSVVEVRVNGPRTTTTSEQITAGSSDIQQTSTGTQGEANALVSDLGSAAAGSGTSATASVASRSASSSTAVGTKKSGTITTNIESNTAQGRPVSSIGSTTANTHRTGPKDQALRTDETANAGSKPVPASPALSTTTLSAVETGVQEDPSTTKSSSFLRESTMNGDDATRIGSLRIGRDVMVNPGQPIGLPVPPGYVLPRGAWWVGVSVGMGTVNGQWKGEDAAVLQSAEEWKSTAQAGLLVGREWRSGWCVSTGLSLARVRSTFHHEDPGTPQTTTDVDTNWTTSTFAGTSDILYTWVIDSLVETSTGAVRPVESRNLYTALQIPLTLHWHTNVRRMRYGAFGGISAWIPMQRSGLTLAQPATDSRSSTIALQDPQVNDRFLTQLHGQLGLSVGYMITEQFSIHAEPMVSAPLLSSDGPASLWLTRPLLQLRLQHEFRSKPR